MQPNFEFCSESGWRHFVIHADIARSHTAPKSQIFVSQTFSELLCTFHTFRNQLHHIFSIWLYEALSKGPFPYFEKSTASRNSYNFEENLTRHLGGRVQEMDGEINLDCFI
jgi:hypothetical protein